MRVKVLGTAPYLKAFRCAMECVQETIMYVIQ